MTFKRMILNSIPIWRRQRKPVCRSAVTARRERLIRILFVGSQSASHLCPFCSITSIWGPHEGRTRAVEHVLEQPNLFLETSWCGWEQVHQMVEDVGPSRVMFGSDASVDGHHHFCRHPPNVEGVETYNDGLLSLTRALGPEVARQVLGDNARRLFGVGRLSRGS